MVKERNSAFTFSLYPFGYGKKRSVRLWNNQNSCAFLLIEKKMGDIGKEIETKLQ